MFRFVRLRIALAVVSVCFDCACTADKVDDAEAKVDAVAEKAADVVAAEIEAKLFDYLWCNGLANEQVLGGVKSVLADRDRITVKDLLAAPDGVAELVGSARDSRAILANVAAFARLFAENETLLDGGKPAWAHGNCTDKVSFPCLTGNANFNFQCIGGYENSTGIGKFKTCRLGAFELDGDVTVSVRDNLHEIHLKFDQFRIDGSRTLNGMLELSGDPNTTGLAMRLDAAAGKPLTIRDYGGHDGGLSCGRTVEIKSMELKTNPPSVASYLEAQADVTIKTANSAVALTTETPHLSWSLHRKCTCPDPLSAVKMIVPRPGGDVGDTVTLRVGSGDALTNDANSCATVSMLLDDWPTDCSTKDKLTKGCGESARDAAQKVASQLATRMCVPLSLK